MINLGKLNISILLFTSYLTIIIFTDYSLTGFWTDIIFTVIFSYIIFYSILKKKNRNSNLRFGLTAISMGIWTMVLCLTLGVFLLLPFGWDYEKTVSFNYQSSNKRLFNAYFKPVGSYSGGEGNFWITESPKYFPIVEVEKYYKHAINWDFRLKDWEGEPISQNEIVKNEIMKEIIEKGK